MTHNLFSWCSIPFQSTGYELMALKFTTNFLDQNRICLVDLFTNWWWTRRPGSQSLVLEVPDRVDVQKLCKPVSNSTNHGFVDCALCCVAQHKAQEGEAWNSSFLESTKMLCNHLPQQLLTYGNSKWSINLLIAFITLYYILCM